jgi:hypothetical protein
VCEERAAAFDSVEQVVAERVIYDAYYRLLVRYESDADSAVGEAHGEIERAVDGVHDEGWEVRESGAVGIGFFTEEGEVWVSGLEARLDHLLDFDVVFGHDIRGVVLRAG